MPSSFGCHFDSYIIRCQSLCLLLTSASSLETISAVIMDGRNNVAAIFECAKKLAEKKRISEEKRQQVRLNAQIAEQHERDMAMCEQANK